MRVRGQRDRASQDVRVSRCSHQRRRPRCASARASGASSERYRHRPAADGHGGGLGQRVAGLMTIMGWMPYAAHPAGVSAHLVTGGALVMAAPVLPARELALAREFVAQVVQRIGLAVRVGAEGSPGGGDEIAAASLAA